MNRFFATTLLVWWCLFCMITTTLVLEAAAAHESNNDTENATENGNENDSDDNQACKSIQSGNKGQQFNVLCIGKVRERMLVVTSDWLVYDLPSSSLSGAINRLYLNGSKPIPLKDKWPTLYKSANYQNSYQKLYNCFTVVDSQADYLIATVKGKHDYNGFKYDIAKDNVTDGYFYKDTDDQVLISSNELKNFYAINLGVNGDPSQGLHIMRYRFDGDTVSTSTQILPDVPDIFYPMCAVGSDKLTVVKGQNQKQCKHLQWPVLKGFIEGGMFYLFGGNFIFTYPQSVYEENNDKPVHFATVPMGTFIQCSGDVDPNQPKGGEVKEGNLSWGIIVAIVLLILLLLLCCILFLARVASGDSSSKKKDTNPSSNSNKQSGGGDGGSSSPSGSKPQPKTHRSKLAPATANALTLLKAPLKEGNADRRSVNTSVQPGMLTGKVSGSGKKRSSKKRSLKKRLASSKKRSHSGGASARSNLAKGKKPAMLTARALKANSSKRNKTKTAKHNRSNNPNNVNTSVNGNVTQRSHLMKNSYYS